MGIARILYPVLIFCLSCLIVNGQTHYLIDYFKAIPTNDGIVLIWQMGKGNQCSGLAIHRSTDGLMYSKIGEIQGICGSDTTAQQYTFEDLQPVPGKVHSYFLELGFFGKTDPPLRVFFPDFSKQTSIAIPNPSSGNVKIIFPNPQEYIYKLEVFNSLGVLVETQQTESESFSINVGSYEPSVGSKNNVKGIFFYQITDLLNGIPISAGKLISVD